MSDLYVSQLTVSSGTYKIRDNEAYQMYKNLIFVEKYGAIGDGITDSTEAIQTAINENPNSQICFKGGRYLISKPIQLIDFKGNCINLGGATIFTNTAINSIFNIATPAGVGASNMLINGTIDCNGVANYGIYLQGYFNLFNNLTILDPVLACVYDNGDSSSPQKMFNNIYCCKKDDSNLWSENTISVGMILSHDCFLNNVHIGRFQKGIKFTGENNLLNNIHIWTQFKQENADVNLFNLTQAIIFDESLSITNFYLDNFKYGCVSTKAGSVFISGLQYLQIGVTKTQTNAYIVKDVGTYKLDVSACSTVSNINVYPELNRGYIAYSHRYADINIITPPFNEPFVPYDIHDVVNNEPKWSINGSFSSGNKIKLGKVTMPQNSSLGYFILTIVNQQYSFHRILCTYQGNPSGNPTVSSLYLLDNRPNADYSIGVYPYSETLEDGYVYNSFDIYVKLNKNAAFSFNMKIEKLSNALCYIKDNREPNTLVSYTGTEISLASA